jgi:hypothetical protein
LIDKKFKPYLLEVNHAPSFNDDTEVDKHVKTELITDTIRLLNITYAGKQRIQEAHRKALETNQAQKKPARLPAEDDLLPPGDPALEESEEEARTYERYQLDNLGDYEKIYPFAHASEDGEACERWDLYEQIREHAREVWVKQTGVNNQKAGAEKKEAVQMKQEKKPFSFGGQAKKAA